MNSEREAVFTLRRTADHPGLPAFLAAPLERLLGLRYMGREYGTLPSYEDPSDFIEEVFRRLEVRLAVCEEDLQRFPATGPLVVVANHPYGGIEGLALALVLRQARPDVRVLANYMLGRIPEIRELFFFVDPFDTRDAARRNVVALRRARRWLSDGGLLVVFPAGGVAHLNLRRRRVIDPPWSSSVARLIRWAACAAAPVWFEGRNGWVFQLAGLVHPALRTALLPRALLARRGAELEMRIGGPVPYSRLAECAGDEAMVNYLRDRTEVLAARSQPPGTQSRSAMQPRRTPPSAVAVVNAVDPNLLEEEVVALPPDQLMTDTGEQRVFVAQAAQIPNLLREIGRLRELTFRDVGEGTGRALDLDHFDERYRHLFIWHRTRREVVGAYRLGLTDELLAADGLEGLYTSTLFRFNPQFFETMGPALELGRSFIRTEYQRSFSGLLLLWKGIGRFIQTHPEHPVLFGPVSISADYRSASQQLIAAFLKQNAYHHPWSRWVRPRHPFRPQQARGLHLQPCELRDLDDVSAFIADIEVDRKGVPVLLRQYLKLGGRLLGFNVDPDFANVLDVLVMLDLRQTSPRILGRYMGTAGAKEFLDRQTAGDPQL